MISIQNETSTVVISALITKKNAATCEKQSEPQDQWMTRFLNAICAVYDSMFGSDGRLLSPCSAS